MTLSAAFAALRTEYMRMGLREEDVLADPVAQFERWMRDAIAAGVLEPTAMTLATSTPGGEPSARVVLLKDVDARGFTFFTNYQSAKGRTLAANPRAALTFHWRELERQVRVGGEVAPVDRAESEAYFATRPRGSQLGAWASPQSDVVASRAELELKLATLETQYEGAEVPCPPWWGGYRVAPRVVELWQGRPNRLHDRLRYTRVSEAWLIERLGP